MKIERSYSNASMQTRYTITVDDIDLLSIDLTEFEKKESIQVLSTMEKGKIKVSDVLFALTLLAEKIEESYDKSNPKKEGGD